MKENLWLDNEDYREKIVAKMAEVERLGRERTDIRTVIYPSDMRVMEWESRNLMLGDVSVGVDEHEEHGYFSITHYTLKKGDRIFAEVWRNYSAYPQNFFRHSNGKLYFCCGFDYQGYTIINCDDEIVNHYLPEEALKGWGWCPTDWISYDLRTNEINVEGCYWGGPYEIRTYDFSNPDVLPLPLLRECDVEYDSSDDDDEEETSEE